MAKVKSKVSKSGAPKKGLREKIRTTKKVTKKLKSATKKVVDEVYLRVSPKVLEQIEKMNQLVSSGQQGVNELRLLGLKILEKAQVVQNSLKQKTKSKRSTQKR